MKRKLKISIFINDLKEAISVIEETEMTKEEYINNINEVFNSNNIVNIFLVKKCIAVRPSQLKLILVEEIGKKNDEEYLEEE